MRIVDLLKKQSIDLNAAVADKTAAIGHLVDLMDAGGNLNDKELYKERVLAREAEGSTGIGEGIAIPHAKTEAVNEPGLASMIVRDGVDYESLDDEPAHLFFMIAAPAGGADVHLEVLSRLSRMLMDDDFRNALMQAKTPEEYLATIDKAEAEQIEAEAAEAAAEAAAEEAPAVEAAPSERPFIVGVTACPTGIAHTYMAAEALENKAAAMGVDIKVETNGSGGVKNHLTEADIKRAVGVIVAVDKDVPVQRFAGKKVIFTKVANGIKIPEELIQTVLDGKAPVYQGSESSSESVALESAEKESVGRQIYKHLMNGVSHMLPFVIGGGILIALAFLFDMDNAGAANFGSGTPVAALLKNIGGLSFSMMMPILAGYIAMSIGERPALMPGIVGGFLATTGGSGFFGALFAGFIAGYLVLLLKKVLSVLPESLEGTKPILFYPVLGLVLIGLIMTFVINPPTAIFNTWLFDSLNSMTTSSRIVLGFVLGGMMSIDFGGPINKAAYVFGTASLMSATGQAVSSGIMASVMAGGMVPPLAIALAMLIFRNKFTPKERQSTITNFIMGLSFITEGAIPFAASDPLRVIPTCAIGSAVAGSLSMLFGCALPAPHGGIFVFGVITNWPMYIVSLIAGVIVAAILLGIFRKKRPQE
ncbi:MAG: fructose-specific PTS transporter subunit EIIC [Megasphaera massiliensis]|uniref:PTS fructose transporter subunit IIABC n=1 Tax=Megasphaera massiliensis TaxID=1232428 RepID=UPI00210BC8D8|nr:PTS fructose transporter subunit IIABC [Megasphaera massiliensis]MCQ5210180.1 fructose-specific PTS transporter subunit EIIC [Megasphaera massiliensis]MEE0658277.1 fructose-specific PTS transporter subunit EIIC [Megasphaera massiliensis]